MKLNVMKDSFSCRCGTFTTRTVCSLSAPKHTRFAATYSPVTTQLLGARSWSPQIRCLFSTCALSEWFWAFFSVSQRQNTRKLHENFTQDRKMFYIPSKYWFIIFLIFTCICNISELKQIAKNLPFIVIFA